MFRIVGLACLSFVTLISLSCGDKPDVYAISIPNLKTAPDESVLTIEIDINAGTIQSIANMPIGWQWTIDNDANWISKIRGRATLRSATLSADELKRLSFGVRRNETPTFKFAISGRVSLGKTFDVRTLELKSQDFALTGTE